MVSNLEYLDDYYRHPHAVSESIKTALQRAVIDKPGLTLEELRQTCPKASANDVHSLIATGGIYIDLTGFRLLDETAKIRVFRDATLAKMLKFVDQHTSAASPEIMQIHEGATISWGNRTLTVANWVNGEVLLTGDGDLRMKEQTIGDLLATGEMVITASSSCNDNAQNITEFLSKCSEAVLEKGHRRYEIYNDPTQFMQLPARTREHWRSNIRMFTAEFGNEFAEFGLIPRNFACGRKPLMLPQSVEDVLSAAFNEFEDKRAISPNVFWCRAKAIAKGLGVLSQLCHKRTGKKWLESHITLKTIETREGLTVAKSKTPAMPVVPGTDFARWPWDKAYIDHTKVDLRLLLPGMFPDDDTDETLRPWLSVMIDGYSRKILAFVLDYNSPSNKTCMLLIRECVRKHRYLPRTLGMDGGKEFRSVYFRSLMALCKITAEYRPPHRPRFGAQIERWFGTANTQLFHQLLGNTKVMRNVRQVTPAIDPSNLATWTLETLDETLSEFCYSFYNENAHSSLMCSPNQKHDAGIKEHGLRQDRRFEFTEDFVKWTLPSTSTGLAKVTRDGISVFNLNYWVQGMTVGTKLMVRYDPCDISRVYVFMNKQWVWAKCGLHPEITGMSEKQREIASKALRTQQRAAGVAQDSGERKMGQFLGTTAAKEAMLTQKKKDAALARIMKAKQGQVMEVAPTGDVMPKVKSRPSVELPPRKVVPVYRSEKEVSNEQ